jgi:hypothetical protein
LTHWISTQNVKNRGSDKEEVKVAAIVAQTDKNSKPTHGIRRHFVKYFLSSTKCYSARRFIDSLGFKKATFLFCLNGHILIN